MTRKMVWASIGVVLIVAGITAVLAQTQHWRVGRGPFWFHGGPMGYMAHELDLSDTQKSQIKSIWDGERPNVAELVHEFASEQKEMDALTSQGTPDEGRIQDVGTREGATLAKLIVEKEKLTSRIYSQVLDPAQQKKADEIRRRWGSRLDKVANRIGDTNGTR